MRGEHEHDVQETQDRPADNTSRYVRAQVNTYHNAGHLIHAEIAREIAAGFASPGTEGGRALATFATTGRVTSELQAGVMYELWRLTQSVDADYADDADVRDIKALDAYVREAALLAGHPIP